MIGQIIDFRVESSDIHFHLLQIIMFTPLRCAIWNFWRAWLHLVRNGKYHNHFSFVSADLSREDGSLVWHLSRKRITKCLVFISLINYVESNSVWKYTKDRHNVPGRAPVLCQPITFSMITRNYLLDVFFKHTIAHNGHNSQRCAAVHSWKKWYTSQGAINEEPRHSICPL